MGTTSKEAGRQSSTGFRTTMKVLRMIHCWLYRASGGKWGRTFLARQYLLLTTTGGMTGRSRTWPLTYLSEGDRLIVIASNGRQPTHPSWYLNLLANPCVDVQLGKLTRKDRAGRGRG
ncbi:MAG: nitroreductase family deazaflavin-dependent oxidoreductase [Rubrobacter sp.]|nr:nitroreductase family deazaflavin-dependent oxidoreductase [Rubrobacter sp.]